ncbi:MAG: DUF3006 domain-containing protein [Gemmatimonadetes bacterium]|nr:DUF3006 domain-containing protein [Gemmatimonadota bacterium]
MTQDNFIAVVDRIEGRTAVLEKEDGSLYPVSEELLPEGAGEGSVLQVYLDQDKDGGPVLLRLELDPEETQRRLKHGEAILDELRKRDPGGDVVM